MAASYAEIEHYVNGAWRREGDATVSILDHSFLYGDGVFDTVCAKYGYIYKLDEHLDRLLASARAVSIELPVDRDTLRGIVVEAAARNRLADAYLRIVLSRGMTGEPLLDPRGAVPTLVVLVRPYLHVNSPEAIERGLSAKVVSRRHVSHQSLDPRVKSNNYLALVLAKLEASRAGADVALLLDEHGDVCEGSGYNLFVVRSSVATTPPRSALRGITAASAIELARELEVDCRYGALTTYDLAVADEVFLTSTAGGIMAVTSVDGAAVGDGRPGPITRRIRDAYERAVAAGRDGTRIPLA